MQTDRSAPGPDFGFGTERPEVQILSPRQKPSDCAGLRSKRNPPVGKRDFRSARLVPADPIARFWARVDRRGADDCWPWLAGAVPGGYGRFHVDGRPVATHRFAYELACGPIPDGLQLDHLCRNRICVNPAHLEPVTCRENVRRGIGISAVNARKTSCDHGHPLSGDNLVIVCGRRTCRACRVEINKRHTENRREAAKLLPPKPRKPRVGKRSLHCHRGHALTEDNRRGGKGRCMECRRIDGRAYWTRKAAARQAVSP